MRESCFNPRYLCAAAAALLLTTGGGALAQPADDFVPVTEAMLEDPAPGDGLTWRRTLDTPRTTGCPAMAPAMAGGRPPFRGTG